MGPMFARIHPISTLGLLFAVLASVLVLLGEFGTAIVLLVRATLSIDDQCQALPDRFRMWKGEEEQVDDVLLIGVEIQAPGS
jgi:hypothetical protein